MGSRPHDLGQVFRNADADHDGVVTRAEFADAGARLFARLDRDGDGYLTSADRSGRMGRRRNASGSGAAEGLTAAMDADGDGRISRDEFDRGFGRLFDRADANHDGVVDAQEMAALRPASR
ncbi:MAG TPA: signal transduction protein [Phenylobacterium sp.]|nr:signal transduction protein [Phenylobacterium sp.]